MNARDFEQDCKTETTTLSSFPEVNSTDIRNGSQYESAYLNSSPTSMDDNLSRSPRPVQDNLTNKFKQTIEETNDRCKMFDHGNFSAVSHDVKKTIELKKPQTQAVEKTSVIEHCLEFSSSDACNRIPVLNHIYGLKSLNIFYNGFMGEMLLN